MKFKVGDVVKVKSWEEMEEEYGLDENGWIDVPYSFTSQMEEYFGNREATYTVKKVIGIEANIVVVDEVMPFTLSEEMLRFADEEEKEAEERNPLIDFDLLNYFSEYVFFGEIKANIEFDFNHSYGYKERKIIRNIFWLFNVSGLKTKLIVTRNAEWFYRNSYSIADSSSIGIAKDLPDDILNELEALNKEREDFALINFEDGVAVINNYGTIIFFKEWSSDKESSVKLMKVLHEHLGMEIDSELYEALLALDTKAIKKHLEPLLKRKEEEYQDKKRNEFYEKVKAALNNVQKVQCEGKIRDLQSRIENYESNLKELYLTLREKKKDLVYFTYCGMSEKIKDFIEVLKNDKDSIVSYKTFRGETGIFLEIKTPLSFFEDEDWKLVKKGVLEKCEERYRGVVDAIFKRQIELMTDTAVLIRINNYDVRFYEVEGYKYGIPNPHIYYYNCWGDNESVITKHLTNQDYAEAYMQIKASLSGINLTDGPVITRFVEGLADFSDIPCIRDFKTNKTMTLEEASGKYVWKEEEVEE